MADYDSRCEEAVQFLNLVVEADSNNRAEAMEDLRFAAGEQWPAEQQNSRQLESRPCLTINKVDAYIRQICNQQRQQRPRIKVQPINTEADAKVAEVIQGLVRHIEVKSSADHAYDTAFEAAVTHGLGYWRIRTEYKSPESFDQDIVIDTIDNPFTVYNDPNSVAPDGSDSTRCMLTDTMSKTAFEQQYPGAESGGGFSARGGGDSLAEWVSKEDIRVAEYYRIEREKDTLLRLSDGSIVLDSRVDHELRRRAQLEVVGSRPTWRKQLIWQKLTALEVLEEKRLPGSYIPVIPCYGMRVVIDGKRKRWGIVRFAKDPQRMVNYWETSATESIALAPKAKWLIAEGQDEGHENEWASANRNAAAVLRYKQTDIDGQPAPPPSRLQPEPPPVGILQSLQLSSQNLREVIGVIDPAQRVSGNISGKALQGEKSQSDNAVFNFYDNLTRSIAHTGRIILELIPHYYDTERVERIIGDDGRPELVKLNEKQVDKVLNDVTVGEYDVVMETGPGYDSKRQEAVELMAPLFQGSPDLMKIAGDVFVRNMDFPGADVIADRLAASNPLANIDDGEDIDSDQAKMMIKQLQTQLQQAHQALQAAQMEIKMKSGIEHDWMQTELKKTLMQTTGKAHDIEMATATKRHDTEMRAETTLRKAEIDQTGNLLAHKMNNAHELDTLQRAADDAERESAAKAKETEQ